MRQGAILIDLRGADAFCPEHPAGALNIAYGPKVGYWAGWVVLAGTRIVLLASNAGEAAEAGRQLLRVGLDAVEGYIDGGIEAWRRAGLPTSAIEQIGAGDFRERLRARRADGDRRAHRARMAGGAHRGRGAHTDR